MAAAAKELVFTSAAPDLVIRSRRVVLPDGVRPAAVVTRAGRIDAVVPWDETAKASDAVDCGDAWIMPGLVDTHVHVNEPGRGAWEGLASATRAAAAGGITTLVDMPLNSTPATTTRMALAAKRITPSHLHERLDPSEWPRELRTVAEGFNVMLDGLEESFARLSRFSSELAHEMRTPIHILMNNAEAGCPPNERPRSTGKSWNPTSRNTTVWRG